MKINWLNEFAKAWQARVAQDRVPHALLLLGPAGVGKRAAAAWLARERLALPGAGDGPVYPLEIPEHPDMRWLRPPEDKKFVGIEQVRDLVAGLSLTSYTGGGKVAVIDPANAMTANAANSLLKTLEEPSGDALIILVADRLGRLPATIMSRCQRVSLSVPASDVSLRWLHDLDRDNDWSEALRLAGNAPLAAVDAQARLTEAQTMAQDFKGLAEHRGSPIEVASRWAKFEPSFVLDWLCQSIQDVIRQANGLPATHTNAVPSDSVLRRIDRRNLFCYLDIINRLRGQAAGSFNLQLTLESLLIDWAGGLRNCHRSFGPGELLPKPA